KANIFALTYILSPEYTVYAAKNGRDAVEIAQAYMPDVILLDIVMPEMDGYAVITALKSSEKTKEIPVIFITGLCNAEAEEKGLALGASDYISKPFSSAIVKLRVRNQIQIQDQIKMIKDFSMTDLLTGLPNRRSFDYRLQLEWEHAKRYKTALSIVIVDIDRFKMYNDTYGHLQGDTALQSVANNIEQSLNRSIDFVARWGGEEFFILLPTTNLSGALKTAENIRQNVENTPIPYINDKITKVTISAGVNTITPLRDDSARDFIDRADQAVYTAKKTGRNRVCAYDGIINGDVP
ncbi:MAG: diguanylate cyclase, partial [Treponema sp.]|nr:diguanylate cyclase [Treponema sp.]